MPALEREGKMVRWLWVGEAIPRPQGSLEAGLGKQGLTTDPAGELTEVRKDLATWGGASAARDCPWH